MKTRYLIVELFLEVCRKNAMVLNEGFTLKVFKLMQLLNKNGGKKVTSNKRK